jgi:hypothetical protein
MISIRQISPQKGICIVRGPHGAMKHIDATQSFKQQFLRCMGFYTVSSTYFTVLETAHANGFI